MSDDLDEDYTCDPGYCQLAEVAKQARESAAKIERLTKRADALAAISDCANSDDMVHVPYVQGRIEDLPSVTVPVVSPPVRYCPICDIADCATHRDPAALTPTAVDASQATDPVVNSPGPAAIRIADEVCDFFDAKGQNAEAFGAAEVGQRLRDAMQTDPAAIREALRIVQSHVDYARDEGAFDAGWNAAVQSIETEILALIAKGAAE